MFSGASSGADLTSLHRSVSGSGTDFDSLCCSSCLFWHFDVPKDRRLPIQTVCVPLCAACQHSGNDNVAFYSDSYLACAYYCRCFGVALGEQQEAVTEEEIISIVDEAHEQGVIEKMKQR